VLNKKRYVSREATEKVMQAIRQLNYNVDMIAHSMKSKYSMMIGVIIPDITRIFFPQVLAGIQSATREQGYNIIIYSSEHDINKEKDFIRILSHMRVDGIILDSMADHDDDQYVQMLVSITNGKKHVPVVSMERDFSQYGIDSIIIDNEQGAYLATRLLIDRGAKNIALYSSFSKQGGLPRFNGYCRALRESGFALNNNLLVKSESSAWAGYSVTRKLLMNGIHFDGLFAGNDQRAVGAIKALHEHGVRIPQDVMVVGFDNTFVSSMITPPLTTINVPKHRMGREAAEHLMQLIADKGNCVDTASEHAGKRILLPIELIERESTLAGKTTAWDLEDWEEIIKNSDSPWLSVPKPRRGSYFSKFSIHFTPNLSAKSA